MGCREQNLEEREKTLAGQQAEAAGLKAELHSLAGTLRLQAEQGSAQAAKDQQGLAHQQARLDTLQVSLVLHHRFCWHEARDEEHPGSSNGRLTHVELGSIGLGPAVGLPPLGGTLLQGNCQIVSGDQCRWA